MTSVVSLAVSESVRGVCLQLWEALSCVHCPSSTWSEVRKPVPSWIKSVCLFVSLPTALGRCKSAFQCGALCHWRHTNEKGRAHLCPWRGPMEGQWLPEAERLPWTQQPTLFQLILPTPQKGMDIPLFPKRLAKQTIWKMYWRTFLLKELSLYFPLCTNEEDERRSLLVFIGCVLSSRRF